MGKKSQIEIMGLIVIVILVIVAFLVYIVLTSYKEPVNIDDEVTDQLSQNFLSSLVKTETTCSHTVIELIRDCNLNKEIECGTLDSCTYVKEEIGKLFPETLDKWGYAYYFEIPKMEYIHTNPNSGKPCDENTEKGTQGYEIISLYGKGDVLITLDICRS